MWNHKHYYRSGIIIADQKSVKKWYWYLRCVAAVDVRGAPVIVGFSETTILPTLAATYVAQTLQLPLIGYVSSTTSLPAAALISSHFPMHMVRTEEQDVCAKRFRAFFPSDFENDSLPRIRHR